MAAFLLKVNPMALTIYQLEEETLIESEKALNGNIIGLYQVITLIIDHYLCFSLKATLKRSLLLDNISPELVGGFSTFKRRLKTENILQILYRIDY